MLKQYRYEEVGPDGSVAGFDFVVNYTDFIAGVEKAMEAFTQFMTLFVIENEKSPTVSDLESNGRYSATEAEIADSYLSIMRGNIRVITEVYIGIGRYTRAMEMALLLGSPQPTVYGGDLFLPIDEVPFTPPTIHYVGEVEERGASPISVKEIEEMVLKGPLLAGYLNSTQLLGLDVSKVVADVIRLIDMVLEVV